MAKAKKKAGNKKRKSTPAKRKTARRVGVKGKTPVRSKTRPASRRAVAARRPAARPDPLRELAQRVVDLSVAGDDEGCLALYAEGAVSIEPGTPPYVGIAALRQKYAQFRSMITRMESQPRRVWTDGHSIVIEWANKMTFADGRTVDATEVAIHEIENGKIARERYYYDRSGMQP